MGTRNTAKKIHEFINRVIVRDEGNYANSLTTFQEVVRMEQAWLYASMHQRGNSLTRMFGTRQLSTLDILHMARVISPKNSLGYRGEEDIQIPGEAPWNQIEAAMEQLIADIVQHTGTYRPQNDATAFFNRFMQIAPFKHYNRRVGLVLYNLLCGTLESPEYPLEPEQPQQETQNDGNGNPTPLAAAA